MQVDYPIQQAVDQEVELAQAEQRERVCGEHQVDVLGQAEKCWNRIERK